MLFSSIHHAVKPVRRCIIDFLRLTNVEIEGGNTLMLICGFGSNSSMRTSDETREFFVNMVMLFFSEHPPLVASHA